MEFLSKLWIGGVRAQKKKKENFKVESKRSSSSSDSTTNKHQARLQNQNWTNQQWKVQSIINSGRVLIEPSLLVWWNRPVTTLTRAFQQGHRGTAINRQPGSFKSSASEAPWWLTKSVLHSKTVIQQNIKWTSFRGKLYR